MLDDSLGCIQNDLCGTVILLQQNLLGIWVIFAEAVDIAVISTAPFVNGLVTVADDKNIVVTDGKPLNMAYWAVLVS